MIQQFVDIFQAKKIDIREGLRSTPPNSYDDIFRSLVSALYDENDYGGPDPARITAIDHGDYQGTRVFTVAGVGYQTWACCVSYGSCSGCDSFKCARGKTGYDESATDASLDDYMLMMLHMVQELKEIS